MISNNFQVSIGKAKQLALGVLHIGGAALGAIAQAELVNPGDAADAAGEADDGLVGGAPGLEVAGGAQLGEHLRAGLDAPGFAAQLSGLPGRVGSAVGVALGEDALLLAAAQRLGDVTGQAGPLGWLQAQH